jgi:hypothetical protein
MHDLIAALIAGADEESLDPISILAIVAIESDFNPKATNRVSSAAGLFQFLDGTWESEGGESFDGRGGVGNGLAAGATVAAQIAIGCRFTAKNRDDLENALGQEPTPTQLYMAHQQGRTGAKRLLKADKNAPVEEIIGVKKARDNRLDGLSVGRVIASFGKLVAKHIFEVRDLVEDVPVVSSPRPPQGPGDTAFGDSAAEVAESEMRVFARRADGSAIKETEERLLSRTLEYFKFVGSDNVSDPSVTHWSAAFISFVMGQAGATKEQFRFSAGHVSYIFQALQNRVDGKDDASIVYFDRNEIAPRVGDLVGFSRDANVKTLARHPGIRCGGGVISSWRGTPKIDSRT